MDQLFAANTTNLTESVTKRIVPMLISNLPTIPAMTFPVPHFSLNFDHIGHQGIAQELQQQMPLDNQPFESRAIPTVSKPAYSSGLEDFLYILIVSYTFWATFYLVYLCVCGAWWLGEALYDWWEKCKGKRNAELETIWVDEQGQPQSHERLAIGGENEKGGLANFAKRLLKSSEQSAKSTKECANEQQRRRGKTI